MATEESTSVNLLVIRNAGLPGRYMDNWRDHAGHSEGYVGKGM